MYLRKKGNQLEIEIDSSVTYRLKILLLSLTNGTENNDYISVDFDTDKFSKIIDFLNKKELLFELNLEAKAELDFLLERENSFKVFSTKALEIKNNLSEGNKDYLEFLNVIKPTMTRRLFDFQARAAYHMAFAFNSCNFSVPGTGKTSIVYAAYSYLKQKGIVDKIIIIGPLSAYYPWFSEYEECFGHSPEIVNLSDFDNEAKKSYLTKHLKLQKEIEFINYEGLRNTIMEFQQHIKKCKTMIVLDEAHKIKNPSSLRSQAISEISSLATSRVILTGTPMPNGYQDLYNLFNFIWPKKNVIGFKLSFLKNHNFKLSDSDLKLLLENIDPFYVRISKEQLGLPKAIFHDPIKVKMGNLQGQIYETIKETFLSQTFKESELALELKKSKLVRLMQSLTNPGSVKLTKYEKHESESLYQLIKNYENLEIPPKYETTRILVNQIVERGEKVIIWAIYTHNIDTLKKYIENQGIKVEVLNGVTENDVRIDIIKQFHTDDNLKVIIANPSAVAESISLHKVCKNAIYLEKSFNASHYMQSKDRIHRVGLKGTDVINYYFILCDSTIDEAIHSRVLEKESAMLKVIEGKVAPLFDNSFISDLNNDDIEYIENYLKGI